MHPAEPHRWWRWLLLGAAVPFLAFVLLPLLSLPGKVAWPQFQAALANPAVAEAIKVSVAASLLATVLAVVFGTPVAYLLARRQGHGWRLLDGMVDLPMVLPPAVAGVALLMTFGRQGMFGGWLEPLGIRLAFSFAAVVLAELFVAAPFYVRAASAGFAGIDRELEQAAAVDGAAPWQVFGAVTLPLALPHLVGGAVMCWARAMGEFGATIIVAGNLPGRTQTMPLAIYVGFERDLDVALALSLVLLAFSLLVLWGVKGALRRPLNR